MVKLNLLPAKVREAEVLRLVLVIGVAFYIVLAAILAWRYSVVHQQLSAVMVKIRKVETDLVPLQAIADEVKKLTNEKTEQDAKKSKLAELARRQAYLVRVLDSLPDLMLGGQVWLTKLDQIVDKLQRHIVIDGRALSVEAWADFYNNLESQSLVSELKIVGNPVAVVDNGRRLYSFKVSFVMKEPQ